VIFCFFASSKRDSKATITSWNWPRCCHLFESRRIIANGYKLKFLQLLEHSGCKYLPHSGKAIFEKSEKGGCVLFLHDCVHHVISFFLLAPHSHLTCMATCNFCPPPKNDYCEGNCSDFKTYYYNNFRFCDTNQPTKLCEINKCGSEWLVFW
jgi:hypothetical protein